MFDKLNITAKISATIASFICAYSYSSLHHLCYCVQIPKFTNCLLRQRHSPFGPSGIALQHATHKRIYSASPSYLNAQTDGLYCVNTRGRTCTNVHSVSQPCTMWLSFQRTRLEGRGRLVSTMGKTKMKLLRTLMEYIISSARETDFLKQATGFCVCEMLKEYLS